MYLIAAEAQFKLGNLDSATYYINEVRGRAAVPGKKAEMQITSDVVNLDFILDERAREFAGEQLRWFGLKRTGKLVERVRKYNPDSASNIKDFHVVRPILRFNWIMFQIWLNSNKTRDTNKRCFKERY
jgi:hypothetical protein